MRAQFKIAQGLICIPQYLCTLELTRVQIGACVVWLYMFVVIAFSKSQEET